MVAMDPLINMKEQVQFANAIIRTGYASAPIEPDDAIHLAELVLALHEWRVGGGFDPYTVTDDIPLRSMIREVR